MSEGRGLFTSGNDPLFHAEAEEDVVDVVQPPATAAPSWAEEHGAPRLFDRVGDFQPGEYPPPLPGDPPEVGAARYTANRDLWRAVVRWEETQHRLDVRAEMIREREAERARQEAEEEAEEARQAEETARREAAHAALVRSVQLDAGRVGLTVREEVDGWRLLARNPDHPALRPVHPWEPTPGTIITRGGYLVLRATGPDEIRAWLDENTARLLDFH